MTKVSAIVPMRHDSERVPGKNYRPLDARPLYRHVISMLLEVPEISEVVIDTDSRTIVDDAAQAFPQVRVLPRPEHLRAGEISMNDVLLHTISQLDADVIIQTHSTNPFLSAGIVSSALLRYLSSGADCDSAFGVTRLQARLWTGAATPINHDPKLLQRTQDIEPVYLENSCFYIFTPEALRATGNRIGARPLLIEVPAEQAVDIDEESDFRLAEAISAMNSRTAP